MPDNVSSDVTAGTDATATELNNLREDVLRHGQRDMCKLFTFEGSVAIPDSTETTLDLYESGFSYGQIAWDNNAMHDTGGNIDRVTIQNDGVYEVKCKLYWPSTSTGYQSFRVYKNGSEIGRFTKELDEANLVFSEEFELNDGDYLQFKVFHNDGSSLALWNGIFPSQQSWISVKQESKKWN